jgi:hypothetical protein
MSIQFENAFRDIYSIFGSIQNATYDVLRFSMNEKIYKNISFLTQIFDQTFQAQKIEVLEIMSL